MENNPLFKLFDSSSQKQVSITEYKGKSIAIDVTGWLLKGRKHDFKLLLLTVLVSTFISG
jgi:hypothetical protein